MSTNNFNITKCSLTIINNGSSSSNDAHTNKKKPYECKREEEAKNYQPKTVKTFKNEDEKTKMEIEPGPSTERKS